MAFTRLTDDLNIVAALADLPNETDGLTAAELKAKFDEAGLIIQTYINTFLSVLESTAAAGNLGIAPIEDVEAETIQRALEIINGRVNDAVEGVIPDAGITTPKLATQAVTEEKIADGAVSAGKIAAGAVSAGKIASEAVTEGKIASEAVTEGKIADGAVTAEKIANFAVGSQQMAAQSVTEEKIALGAITTVKISDDAVTGAKLAANAVSSVYTATLDTTWTGASAPYSKAQTINGILASDNPIIDIVPSDTYATAQQQVEAWANIYRVVASANTLTFYANEKPTVALPVKVQCIRK